MRIAFVLLSSTFGMHQYTADLTESAVRSGHDVHLVTTERYMADRYGPAVRVHTPLSTEGTGFSGQGTRLGQLAAASRTLHNLQPDVVHLTGVHLWNPALLWRMRRERLPAVHSLHDLDPHPGVRYGSLIRMWNRAVIEGTGHLLVHGERYRQRLTQGLRNGTGVTATPLLHLFGAHDTVQRIERLPPAPSYEPWALFFGRLEAYKGISDLLRAAQILSESGTGFGLVVAGPGELEPLWSGPIPEGVEVRGRHIEDEEAEDLFSRCGVVVLPYTGATQSALIAAAYAFSKPVIVSDSGALAEYVVPGETGWIFPAGDTDALSQQLEEALSDGGRLQRMGQAGRRWYEDRRQQAHTTLDSMYRSVGRRAAVVH